MAVTPSRAEIERAIDEAISRYDKTKKERGHMGAPDNVGELDAEIGGQKFKYNGPINTLATIATLVLVILCLYVLWSHQQDARDASSAFVSAVKEQTTVQREQTVVMREANCLQSYQGPGDGKATFCKQIAR